MPVGMPMVVDRVNHDKLISILRERINDEDEVEE